MYEYEATDCVFSNGKHILPNEIENQFADLEGKWSAIIHSLLTKLSIQTNPNAIIIDSCELKELLGFINNILIRSPKALSYFLSEESYNDAIENNVNTELINRIFEELNFGSSEGILKAAYKKRYFDSELGVSYLKYFEKMSFVFLKPKCGKFITGDMPIRMDIDEKNEIVKSLYLPLSPDYAVNFFAEKTKDRNRIRFIEKEQVKELNKYVLCNPESRLIIANNKNELNKVIQ